MSSFRRLALISTLATGTLSLLSACSILPTAANTSLYSLNLGTPGTSQRCTVSFSIRELKIAGYLDRAEVVTDRSDAQIQASALHLWAAPLKDELRRTVGLAVGQRWENSRLISYPWRYGETPAVALDISIDQLEPVAGRLHMQARWQLIGLNSPGRENTRLIRNSNFQKSMNLPVNDANAVVVAINQALSLLSDEIAQSATEPASRASLCGA